MQAQNGWRKGRISCGARARPDTQCKCPPGSAKMRWPGKRIRLWAVSGQGELMDALLLMQGDGSSGNIIHK